MSAEKINAPQSIPVVLRAPARSWIFPSRTADPHRAAPAAAPDPEVPAKAARRRVTAAYKLHILTLVDAGIESGSLGVLLRREELYSSTLTAWRRQRGQ